MLRFNSTLLLAIVIVLSACGDAQQQLPNAVEQKTAEGPHVKTLEPKIGSTPDISVDAKKNLERLKQLYAKIDSIINTYPNYEAAKQHLTERQIEIWENEEAYSKEDHLDISTWGCSWYCGGGPDSIFASSMLPANQKLDYKAENVHDGSLRTAWVEGASGLGLGQSITFRFPKLSPPVTTVEIFNGYMKSEKVWQDNARVKQLKLYVNDQPYALLNLKDIKSKQIFAIDTLQGTKDGLYLKFEITEVYQGEKYEDVAISDIVFDGIGVHCFAEGTFIETPGGQVEIQDLKIGDKVLSWNELNQSIDTSTVLELAHQPHHNLYELQFSEIKITVTDDHPFYFNGIYYSVKENNQYGIQTKALNVGQQIHFLINGHTQPMELMAIKKLDRCEMTYTITKLDKNSLFFANGACVGVEGNVRVTVIGQNN
ncbi:MAG: hypothetical protein JNJ57_12165 [Saprospiraceae bacterium]|nr:hypothetical protein [Saprospiraceae bacterium]